MSEINIRNMSPGQLYEFANGRYVWKVLRAGGTRGGNYLTTMDDVREYTEVFSQTKRGELVCTWSGGLTTNPGVYDERGLDVHNCFNIFSADQDTSASFKQEHELRPVPLELQRQALEDEERVTAYIAQRIEEESKKTGRRGY